MIRARIAARLRKYADRIDHPGAPKAMNVRFTFEERIGIVFRDDGRGCRLWYLGDEEYERAHTEAGPVLGASNTAWLPRRNSSHLMSGHPDHVSVRLGSGDLFTARPGQDDWTYIGRTVPPDSPSARTAPGGDAECSLLSHSGSRASRWAWRPGPSLARWPRR